MHYWLEIIFSAIIGIALFIFIWRLLSPGVEFITTDERYKKEIKK